MLEMLHQLFRLFRKSVARTTGETPNKIDVITRMYIQSLQIIRAKTDLIKPKSRKKTEEPTEDDKLVAKLFIDQTNNPDEIGGETDDDLEIEENMLEIEMEVEE